VKREDRGLRREDWVVKKVYIEPTNRCNLDCRTCMRNVWDEPLGSMAASTFARIMEGVRAFSPPPLVFFGGLGEPLTHPDIVSMVGEAKRLGSRVELITNGTLLTPEMSHRLIDAGLDMLWASLDGASPESYSDVRLGAALPQVLNNLARFRDLRLWANYARSVGLRRSEKHELGLVFVAMKRNIGDLPGILRLGSRLGITRLMVTNVLPYTPEMCEEVLYARSLTDRYPLVHLQLPGIDIDRFTAEALYGATQSGYNIGFRGGGALSDGHDRCPFIQSDAVAVSWEGNMSPCVPLMHTHTRYVDGREQLARRYVVGNLADHSFEELWNLAEHVRFRDRVERFDFSPCTMCGGCDLSVENEVDCSGNTFPTCGLCPWAQGVVQCP
jgi:MoaA/NifB/PqqE/SkfB family radical SAM enzyme